MTIVEWVKARKWRVLSFVSAVVTIPLLLLVLQQLYTSSPGTPTMNMKEVKVSLAPNKGNFTALRAYVDTVPRINTMGEAGSWSGSPASTVKIEAVGGADSTFDCKVKGGSFDHDTTHTLDGSGRFNEILP